MIQANAPFSSEMSFGSLKGRYSYSKERTIFIAICIFIFSTLILVSITASFISASLIGMVLGAGYVLYNKEFNWSHSIAIYEHGFEHYDGKVLLQCRWDEIKALWHKIDDPGSPYDPLYHTYIIEANSGQKIELNQKLSNFKNLWSDIEAYVAKILRPKYLVALQSGECIHFGPVAMDNKGLYHADKKTLVWEEIDVIERRVWITTVKKIHDRWPWKTINNSEIPNVRIFYELVGHFTKVINQIGPFFPAS